MSKAVDGKDSSGLAKHLRFIAAYAGANLSMEMEYKVSFVTRVFAMVINDLMWMVFWILYFERFPVVQGWQKADVLALWCVCEIGFGFAHSLFGNVSRIARIVAQGDLDFYLVYPKDVLLHTAISRVNASAIGDLLLGPAAFLAFVKPTGVQFGLFLVSGILAAGLFLGFTVLTQSLSFFIGNAEGLAGRMTESLIHFSTYPSGIFTGVTKAILFTLIPAGFINTIPVRIVREFDPVFFALAFFASIAFLVLGVFVFRKGLRRYESGNLMQVRV